MDLEQEGGITEHPRGPGEHELPALKVQGLFVNVCWLDVHLLYSLLILAVVPAVGGRSNMCQRKTKRKLYTKTSVCKFGGDDQHLLLLKVFYLFIFKAQRTGFS